MANDTPSEIFHKNHLISYSRLPVKESYFSMPVRATIGCQNKTRAAENGRYSGCAFCSAYELKGEGFRIRQIDDIKADVLRAITFYEEMMGGAMQTIFLGDADPLVMPTDNLIEILNYIYSQGNGEPKIKYVKTYASVKTILNKPLEELRRLNEAGLTEVYVGFESGDNYVLRNINKGISSEDSLAAGLKLNKAGILISASLIWGIGGTERSGQHAIATADLLNQFNSRAIILNHLFHPNLMIERCDGYALPAKEQLAEEANTLVERLTASSEFLVTEGPCMEFPVEGQLPQDKEKIKKGIEQIVKDNNPRCCAF